MEYHEAHVRYERSYSKSSLVMVSSPAPCLINGNLE